MFQDPPRKQLLEIWRKLHGENRQTLLKFAGFLAAEQQGMVPPEVTSQTPLCIPADENETAVKALKRLKKSYPMIDADTAFLESASGLLMQRVLGATDEEVIGKMEALFQDRYTQWKGSTG